MSKSIGKLLGSGNVGTYGYENNYINYLKNYNTSNVDNTLYNMTSAAQNLSSDLTGLQNYQFDVNNSDATRQRMENATYQSYVDKLTPQYEQQTSALATQLANQGIPVGSEAYQRAMQGLQSAQNSALNDAVYQSVKAGQDAYSQSLNDNINAAQFNNTARQNYVNLIQSLLDGSISGYDNTANLYGIQSGVERRRTAAQQSGWNNLFKTADATAKFTKGTSLPNE